VALHERSYAFVCVSGARRMKKFLRHAQLGKPGKKAGRILWAGFWSGHEHEAVGHGDEAAADEDVSDAIGVVGADELVAEADGAAEIGGPGFSLMKESGPASDDAALDVLGAKNAAEARRRFIKNVFDGAGTAMIFEREGGGESRDAAADDRDSIMSAGFGSTTSGFGFRASGHRIRGRIFLDEVCEVLHIFYRVSGRMPWPRLKMWPGRPAASCKIFGARFQFVPVGE